MLSVIDCMLIVIFQTMDSVYATFTLVTLSALLQLSLTKSDFSAISLSIKCCVETVKDDDQVEKVVFKYKTRTPAIANG